VHNLRHYLEAEGEEGNIDKSVCLICREEEGRSHILQCEGTRVWRDRWLERKFTGIHLEIGIKKITSNKTRDNLTKIAQYQIKYKQKWERAVKKSDERDEKRKSDEEIKM
jgi:DNA-directed RNA polymerase beta' subunit